MKTVLLGGGYGTRMSHSSEVIPKPMVKIGDYPILWHIMKTYYAYGFKDFIICAGYKQDKIKEFFSNYHDYHTNMTVYTSTNKIIYNRKEEIEDWKVMIQDTGLDTSTGGRIKRIGNYIFDDDLFFLSYGDGLSAININKLLEFHKSHGKLATVTAIQYQGRYGTLDLGEQDMVHSFKEKPTKESWISGGYFVLNKKVLDYIEGDNTVFEYEPLQNLAKDGELMAYKYTGFWKAMDFLRERDELTKMWNKGDAPWKV